MSKKIIVSGDFDLPKIKWTEVAVLPSGDFEAFFCDVLSDHYHPTRYNLSF